MCAIERCKQLLQQREQQGNRRAFNSAQDPLIDFASNDYLGLARSLELKEAVFLQYYESIHPPLNGLGATGSRLLTGNSFYAEALEEKIALFHRAPAALLFNSGYMANVGLISSVALVGDVIFYDREVHASTYDGIRLSRAYSYPFRHNDVGHLEKRLQSYDHKGKCFVCIESIYSMDGSMAPLALISALCQEYGAELIVDEAHAVGVVADGGAGAVQQANLSEKIFAQIVTFGKALGCCGAAVLGEKVVKDYLINFSRPFIYTTAPPLHALIAIKSVYDMLGGMEAERRHLRHLIRYFKRNIALCSGMASLCPSSSPIQVLRIGDNHRVRYISQFLAEQGFDVRAILSPTVPRGQECLRICLHAFNTQEQVISLVDNLQQAVR